MATGGNHQQGRPPVAVGLIFSDDKEAVSRFLSDCEAEGLRPVLVRAAYEAVLPASYRRIRVRQPMDYLGADDCDAVHAEVLSWQRRMPSVRLASGVRLAAWSAGEDHPPPLWAWLPVISPYVQVTLRALRLFSRVFERETPASWACLGVQGDAAWLAPLAAQVAARQAPAARGPETVARRTGLVLPWPKARVPAIDYRPIRRRAGYLDALETLARHEREFRYRSRGGFEGHVALVMRGQRGVEWLDSGASGRALALDEYSERMPEALIEACAARNWRLTILYEGPPPRRPDTRAPSERHASFVSELSFSSFGSIAAQLRIPAREQYQAAVARLVAEKAFRTAFTFDGVDVFDQFADYLSRSILNLSVLMTAQTEAWTRAFEAIGPDVIIGGRLESKPWINLAATRAGVPTASIKLGIGDEMIPSVLAINPEGRHERSVQPDALLVWGEGQVRHLKAQVPEFEGPIVPLGRTRSDTFVTEPLRMDTTAIRDRIGLSAKEPVIIWGGTCRTRWGLWPGQSGGGAVLAPESWAACLKGLVQAAARHGARVVVRPHPVEDPAFVEEMVARHGGGRTLIVPAREGVHNVELLAVSDLFVSSVSSMFAEAALMGRVSVNVWLPEIHMIYESSRFSRYAELSEPATSVAAMVDTVDRLMSDPAAYNAALRRALTALPTWFGAADGRNAQRTAAWTLDFAAAAEGRSEPHGSGIASGTG